MRKKATDSIFIIHLLPLELYPPVMNLVDYLSKNYLGKIIVLTTHKSEENSLSLYKNNSSNVLIKRKSLSGTNPFVRMMNYTLFYLNGLSLLIRTKPKAVLYFESLSSWPALIYKKIMGERIKILVHCHEYTDPGIKSEETSLARQLHKIEKKMYPRFSWISHTNPVRLQMFKDDNGLNKLPKSIFHVMPNYPSNSWMQKETSHCNKLKQKKLVFVGSLGYDNMYLQEIVDWVGKHSPDFSLDVYSYNIDLKAKEFLGNCRLENVRFCGGCDYDTLPEILRNYDIGIDIYKPYSLNHVHGVSNKVFEYLACGLDVWFSSDKELAHDYVKEDIFPKIISVNFKDLDSFDYQSAVSRAGLQYQQSNFFYENIYPEILEHIIEHEIKIDI
ncbi:MAG TPA: hypothetical protein VIJ75_09090 [Hanamia sp.]